MNNRILALAGSALFLWWLSSGRQHALKTSQLFDQIEVLVTPLLQTRMVKTENRPFIVTQLLNFMLVSQEYRNLNQVDLAHMHKKDLISLLQTKLNTALSSVLKLRDFVKNLTNEMRQYGFFDDNGLILDAPKIKIILRFISKAKIVLERVVYMGKQVFARLPNESMKSAEILSENFEMRISTL